MINIDHPSSVSDASIIRRIISRHDGLALIDAEGCWCSWLSRQV